MLGGTDTYPSSVHGLGARSSRPLFSDRAQARRRCLGCLASHLRLAGPAAALHGGRRVRNALALLLSETLPRQRPTRPPAHRSVWFIAYLASRGHACHREKRARRFTWSARGKESFSWHGRSSTKCNFGMHNSSHGTHVQQVYRTLFFYMRRLLHLYIRTPSMSGRRFLARRSSASRVASERGQLLVPVPSRFVGPSELPLWASEWSHLRSFWGKPCRFSGSRSIPLRFPAAQPYLNKADFIPSCSCATTVASLALGDAGDASSIKPKPKACMHIQEACQSISDRQSVAIRRGSTLRAISFEGLEQRVVLLCLKRERRNHLSSRKAT